jgi:hypothetical protein
VSLPRGPGRVERVERVERHLAAEQDAAGRVERVEPCLVFAAAASPAARWASGSSFTASRWWASSSPAVSSSTAIASCTSSSPTPSSSSWASSSASARRGVEALVGVELHRGGVEVLVGVLVLVLAGRLETAGEDVAAGRRGRDRGELAPARGAQRRELVGDVTLLDSGPRDAVASKHEE